ncbi:hypothetical protein CBW24_16080 (plasmid) [Pacificitalea manganoxidans]|jgi:hypothetical protein|uniref:EthD domain-containing protein n=1 Tax=Pacificitalea manganoxidans TaxID=1411902 RepID=A0A291M441_9RHOB|nr:hypothetical protein [Pacificitalea manganoxidans]ATI43674.1 hypothetical protein CBW24_16080 [Pacificitalea manganoxidans]
MIKIIYSAFPRADPSDQTAIQLRMEEHGDLVKRHAGALRVAQNVRTPRGDLGVIETIMAAPRGMEPDGPLGLAEHYGANSEDLDFSFQDRDARRAYRDLLEDEKRFAAPGRSSPWVGQERVVIAGAGP